MQKGSQNLTTKIICILAKKVISTLRQSFAKQSQNWYKSTSLTECKNKSGGVFPPLKFFAAVTAPFPQITVAYRVLHAIYPFIGTSDVIIYRVSLSGFLFRFSHLRKKVVLTGIKAVWIDLKTTFSDSFTAIWHSNDVCFDVNDVSRTMKPGNSPLILIIFIYCLKVNRQTKSHYKCI